MNGVHDMGGMHGFGPIEREENEPVFHEPWEGRVHGMFSMRELRDVYDPHGSRFLIESIPPARYLASSYYGGGCSLLRTASQKGDSDRRRAVGEGQALSAGPGHPCTPPPGPRASQAPAGEYLRPATAGMISLTKKQRTSDVNSFLLPGCIKLLESAIDALCIRR